MGAARARTRRERAATSQFETETRLASQWAHGVEKSDDHSVPLLSTLGVKFLQGVLDALRRCDSVEDETQNEMEGMMALTE